MLEEDEQKLFSCFPPDHVIMFRLFILQHLEEPRKSGPRQERDRDRRVNENRPGPVWVRRSRGKHRESIWPRDQRPSGCHRSRSGQRGPWRFECTVPAPPPHARASLHTEVRHTPLRVDCWYCPVFYYYSWKALRETGHTKRHRGPRGHLGGQTGNHFRVFEKTLQKDIKRASKQ